jgi:putative transposase
MKPSRLGVLKVGDRVQFDGHAQTVVGLSGTLVRLAAHDGRPSVVQLTHLLAGEGFEVLGGTAARKPPLSASALAGLRAETADDALRWERHVVEVLTGTDPEAPPGSPPRPGYDPARYSLAQREEAKAAELAATGEKITARTVKRKRQRYESQGLAGLVDHRADRMSKASGRTDERILEALQQAVSEQSAHSTKSASFYLWRTRESSPASMARTRSRCPPGRRSTGSSSVSPSASTPQGRPGRASRWPTAQSARSGN